MLFSCDTFRLNKVLICLMLSILYLTSKGMDDTKDIFGTGKYVLVFFITVFHFKKHYNSTKV